MKVWFDKKETHLMVEDETGHLTWDIYGVPLSDVVFETEEQSCPLRGVRQAHRNHPHQRSDRGEANDHSEAGRSVDFYWNRDKQWPFAGARL